VFASARDGSDGVDLFVKNVNDDTPPTAVIRLPGDLAPTDWPSEDVIVFERGAPSDLWTVDLSGDSAVAREYLTSENAVSQMSVSPSGDLAVYVSGETGRNEVYVRSFPEPGARERVSTNGGRSPFWSPDGNTIYYWTLGPAEAVKTLLASRVERGPPFVVTRTDSLLAGAYDPDNWDLHPDGDRFVITRQATDLVDAETDDNPAPERFLVVVNWFEELKARMGN